MLVLPEWKSETTVINVPRDLMHNISSIQELVGKVSRVMEILREPKRKASGQ